MKFLPNGVSRAKERSRPTRGAWIEIASRKSKCEAVARRAPQGARGLKSIPTRDAGLGIGWSRPTRGAWIEIIRFGVLPE